MRTASVTMLAGIVGCALVRSAFAAEGAKIPKEFTSGSHAFGVRCKLTK